MKLMLDTDVCIYCINRRAHSVLERLSGYGAGEVSVSSITHAELTCGVRNGARAEKNRATLEKFLLPLEVLPFDQAAAEAYAVVRTDLERSGVSIGPNDLLIAAHALSLDVTLATNNVREFERVPGLRVERWR